MIQQNKQILDARLIDQNQRLLQHLNTGRHCKQEINQLVGEIIGQKLSASNEIRLPFYSDYGRNIQIAEDVFINCNVIMSDLGGIKIGNHVEIGPGTSLLTKDCSKVAPIVIKAHAKIGGRVTILPGVTIGENAVVRSGTIVSKNIPDDSMI